jgi:hypothetical protein
MEELMDRLEKCVEEMADQSLAMEEREFAMERALHLLGELRNIYIGGNSNVI